MRRREPDWGGGGGGMGGGPRGAKRGKRGDREIRKDNMRSLRRTKTCLVLTNPTSLMLNHAQYEIAKSLLI